MTTKRNKSMVVGCTIQHDNTMLCVNCVFRDKPDECREFVEKNRAVMVST